MTESPKGEALSGTRIALLAALIFAVFAAYARMYPIDNPDFGWHAALGRYIYENKTVPTVETFSHTAHGRPMVAQEWLSELCYHVAILGTGLLGLRYLHVALMLAILGLFYLLLLRQTKAHALALLGTLLYFVIAHSRFQVRPHIFDMLFLVVAYGALFVRKPALTGRQLAAVFAFVVLWANFHSGVVRFAAVVVIYVAVEALQQLSGWRKPDPGDLAAGDLRRLLALAAIVLAALLITPNHVHLFPYIWESQRINAAWSVEWQSILAAWGKPWLGPLAIPTYGAVLVATALAAVSDVRRVSLASLAVIAFLALLPLSAFRSVDGAFAPILFLAEQFRLAMASRPATFRFVAAAAPILTLAAIYPVLGQELHVKGVNFSSRLLPGNDWNRDEFPVGAVTFLDAVNLRGRLYNPAQWGGYLLYRTYTKYPVFIDGRWADYGEELFKASLAIEYHRPPAFALLDDYRIDILLVPQEWMAQGDPSPQRWIPVFENYSATVFIRDVPANAGDLERCEAYYREHSIPFDRTRGFDRLAAFRANPKWAEAMDVDLGLTGPS